MKLDSIVEQAIFLGHSSIRQQCAIVCARSERLPRRCGHAIVECRGHGSVQPLPSVRKRMTGLTEIPYLSSNRSFIINSIIIIISFYLGNGCAAWICSWWALRSRISPTTPITSSRPWGRKWPWLSSTRCCMMSWENESLGESRLLHKALSTHPTPTSISTICSATGIEKKRVMNGVNSQVAVWHLLLLKV